MSTEWSLLFDSTIELNDPDGHIARAAGRDYWFETLAEGADFGDPQPIEVAIATLMGDGQKVETLGEGNREPGFLVTVKSNNPAAIEYGLAALHLATRKRTTLVGTPPTGYGRAWVWEVETSNLVRGGFDDLALMDDNEVTVRLRIVALPHRRGLEEIVDDADTPPLSGGVVLYDCESTAGWAEWSTAGSPVVDNTIFTEGAGSIRTQAHYPNITTGSHLWYFYWFSYSTDQVTGLSLDTDTGGYLSIAIRVEYADVIPGISTSAGLDVLYMQVDGGAWEEVTSFMAARRDDEGFIHYVWPVAAGLNVTGLRTGVRQIKLDNSGSASDGFAHDPYTWYDDVELLAAASTDHQIVKQHFVQGSARTPGTLQIASPSDVVPLGPVLAIHAATDSVPSGYLPDTWRWIIQGDDTADLTALHGVYYEPDPDDFTDAGDVPVFAPPVAQFTEGHYAAVALVKVESLPLVSGVRAQVMIAGTLTGPVSIAEVSIPSDLETGWQFVPLGTLYLPPLPMQSTDNTVKVQLQFKGAKIADLYLIPAWKVDGQPVAAFTIVDCKTGTVEAGGASSFLWIKSPDPLNPEGSILRGPSGDGVNAQSAWDDTTKRGVHLFAPGPMTHWLTALGAAGPTSTLRYFERGL